MSDLESRIFWTRSLGWMSLLLLLSSFILSDLHELCYSKQPSARLVAARKALGWGGLMMSTAHLVHFVRRSSPAWSDFVTEPQLRMGATALILTWAIGLVSFRRPAAWLGSPATASLRSGVRWATAVGLIHAALSSWSDPRVVGGVATAAILISSLAVLRGWVRRRT